MILEALYPFDGQIMTAVSLRSVYVSFNYLTPRHTLASVPGHPCLLCLGEHVKNGEGLGL